MDKLLAVQGNTHLSRVPSALQGLRGATAGEGLRPASETQAYVPHLKTNKQDWLTIGSSSEPFLRSFIKKTVKTFMLFTSINGPNIQTETLLQYTRVLYSNNSLFCRYAESTEPQ